MISQCQISGALVCLAVHSKEQKVKLLNPRDEARKATPLVMTCNMGIEAVPLGHTGHQSSAQAVEHLYQAYA